MRPAEIVDVDHGGMYGATPLPRSGCAGVHPLRSGWGLGQSPGPRSREAETQGFTPCGAGGVWGEAPTQKLQAARRPAVLVQAPRPVTSVHRNV